MTLTNRCKKTTSIEKLNEHFTSLEVEERLQLLYETFDTEEVLLTSSFGVDSALLLHLVSRVNPAQKVHFIDTGFHFPETYFYKKQLTERFDLCVVDIKPSKDISQLTRQVRLWEKYPNVCCYLNKISVLEALKSNYQVWISGVRTHQTAHRSTLRFFAAGSRHGNLLKCCPLLDMDEVKSEAYQRRHNLPRHPLVCAGFGSIGCLNCTVKGCGRSGRWAGKEKTECGLHLVMKIK